MMTGVYATNPKLAADVAKVRTDRLAAKRAELAARLAKMAEAK
jgi:hypothetical protein